MSVRTTPAAQPTLTVVVPVFRNAETLETLAIRLAAAFDGVDTTYRLLFVVDASPDDSWDRICRLAASDSRVAGLRLATNQGQHRAIIEGFRSARTDWVATLDADLQDPPEVLLAMWVKARAEGIPVAARREGQYQGWGRMLTSRLFKTLLGWWLGMPANLGTFLLLPRAVSDRIWQASVAVPQVVVMARCFSTRWNYVEYQRQTRAVGGSAYSGWGRLRAALRAIRCALACRRLPANGSMVAMKNGVPGAMPGTEYVGQGWS